MPKFQPMLSAKVPPKYTKGINKGELRSKEEIEEDYKNLPWPMSGSPKLDGIRALVHLNEFTGQPEIVTRKLKKVPNAYAQKLCSHFDLLHFDGELIVGDPTKEGVYGKTESGIMSRDGEPDFKYWVFDVIDTKTPFIDRQKYLLNRINSLPDDLKKYVVYVPQNLLESYAIFKIYEEALVNMGYEGIMLRTIDSPYKFGRSTFNEKYLIKVKRFEDSEAEIIGWEPLYHNNNVATVNELGLTERSSHKANKVAAELIGKWLCRDIHTGVEFDVGTGFNMEERALWYKTADSFKGSIIKYKFLPYGVKDKPRHPVFLGFRGEDDL